MNRKIIVFIVFVIALFIADAAEEAQCDCERNRGWFFKGCKIRKAPPVGYKCNCEFRCSAANCPGKVCFGSAKKCSESDPGCDGCKGSKGIECCLGNCKGY